jgi:O-methyltransferase involved in polyketide biosynthesis
MADRSKIEIGLAGVPETLLWNLYHRALEARRPESVLHDPRAVELVEAICYPFEERFGKPSTILAQGQALRCRCFDQEIKRFLSEHPDGTVAALGEGLETQFWRVDDGRVRWLSIDLPEAVEVRRQLLPDSPRLRTLACSALDVRWMEEVDASRGVLLTAQGLLMYFQPDEVYRLIAACAQRFPGGELLFDAVPRWFSARTMRQEMRTPEGYQAPPMPWGMDANEQEKIRKAHPNIVEVRGLRLPRGRGLLYGYLAPLMDRIPIVHNKRLAYALVDHTRTVWAAWLEDSGEAYPLDRA